MILVDAADGNEIGRVVQDPEQLPETFAIATKVRLDEQDWTVVAAEPTTRGEITRAGQVRLVLRRTGPTKMFDPKKLQFSMPTICDLLPARDPAVSLADIQVLVVDEDLWRDVEWVPRRHAREVEANLAAIAAIRTAASGPFPEIHLRKEPVTPLLGSGLTVEDVAAALGPDANRLDGVVIDTLGAGFIKGGFAFLLPGEDAYVYGHCEGGETATLGLHREGPRQSMPPALTGLLGAMRASADADLLVWTFGERIEDADALESWYRSGRACTKIPW